MTKPLSLSQIEEARFEKWWSELVKKDDDLLYAPQGVQVLIRLYARKSWLARARKDCEK